MMLLIAMEINFDTVTKNGQNIYSKFESGKTSTDLIA